MEKNKISEIMEKIKVEGIQPEAKWKINWKNYLFWTIWGGMLFLGAGFFSLIILNFLDLGPDFFHLFNFPLGRIMHLLMMTTPFVWLTLVGIALISGIMAIRKTKWGYRYNLLLITSLSVLAISLLGGFLHFSKVNQRLGGRFYQNFQQPEKDWAFPMGNRWKLPEDGFLGGRVLEIREGSFLLESLEQERWEVFFGEDKKTELKKIIQTEMFVGLVGEKIGENQFEVEFIREIPRNGKPFRDGRGMERMKNMPIQK